MRDGASGIPVRRLLRSSLVAAALLVAPFTPVASSGAEGRADVSAALERACPCAGPAWGGSWASARRYRACARRELRGMVRRGELGAMAALRAFRRARRSSCGRAPEQSGVLPGQGEVRLCRPPGIHLACTPVGRAHADACEECSAALDHRLVGCALYREPGGAESSLCGGALPRRLGAARRVDRRAALDCESCLGKLGTDRPEGMECTRWSCGPL